MKHSLIKVISILFLCFPYLAFAVGNKGEKISEGAFGTVYLDEYEGKKVVVKVMDKTAPEAGVQFTNEVEAFKTLQQGNFHHENIVRMFGSKEDENHYYIYLEYLEGGDLFEFLSERRNYFLENPKIFIKLVKSLSAALYHIHKNGLVYGDLKLENIVLDTEGNFKLVDFGLTNKPNFLKYAFGTTDFMSPEMFFGQGYTHSTDIWSLGVVLAELLLDTPFTLDQQKIDTELQAYINTQLEIELQKYIEDQKTEFKLLKEKDPNLVELTDEILKKLRESKQEKLVNQKCVELTSENLDLFFKNFTANSESVFSKFHNRTPQVPTEFISLVRQALKPVPGNRITAKNMLKAADKLEQKWANPDAGSPQTPETPRGAAFVAPSNNDDDNDGDFRPRLLVRARQLVLTDAIEEEEEESSQGSSSTAAKVAPIAIPTAPKVAPVKKKFELTRAKQIPQNLQGGGQIPVQEEADSRSSSGSPESPKVFVPILETPGKSFLSRAKQLPLAPGIPALSRARPLSSATSLLKALSNIEDDEEEATGQSSTSSDQQEGSDKKSQGTPDGAHDSEHASRSESKEKKAYIYSLKPAAAMDRTPLIVIKNIGEGERISLDGTIYELPEETKEFLANNDKDPEQATAKMQGHADKAFFEKDLQGSMATLVLFMSYALPTAHKAVMHRVHNARVN